MKNQRDLLHENYDKLTKEILLSEQQWDFLLRIQVTIFDHFYKFTTDEHF